MNVKQMVINCGLASLICLTSVASVTAAERCVLAEEFSEEMCTECPLAEAALDSLLGTDFTSAELAVITSLTNPTFPPSAHAEGISRWHYYPDTDHPDHGLGHWTPTVWFDGADEQTGAPGGMDSLLTIYRDKILARLAVPSPLAMNLTVEYSAKADTGMVHVELTAADSIPYQDLHLRMTVVESGQLVNERIINHLLRDYFPDTLGVSLTLSQGDTVNHSEPFVIKPAWQEEECHIVVFVQDDTTREVLQAVQTPLVAAIPAAVSDLSITLCGGDLLLAWPPVTQDTLGHPLAVDHYRIYRDTVAFREPGSDPFQTTADTFLVDDTGVVGDTGKQYFYWIAAVSGAKESADSRGAGEFDTHLMMGK